MKTSKKSLLLQIAFLLPKDRSIGYYTRTLGAANIGALLDIKQWILGGHYPEFYTFECSELYHFPTLEHKS